MQKKFLYLLLIVILGVPVIGLFFAQRAVQELSLRKNETVSQTAPESVGVGESFDIGLMPELPPIFYEDDGFTPDVDRVIVKTANLSLVAEDTRELVKEITGIVEKYKGAVTTSHTSENEYQSGAVTAEMTLRIPASDLLSALEDIKGLAKKTVDELVTSIDKTEQKIDIEAQLNNLKAAETQLRSIMAKAITVEDTLAVQRELTSVRSRIERLEALTKNLEGASAMSTIHIFISTAEGDLPLVDPDALSFWDEIKSATREAIALYRELFVGGLKGIILALPIAVVVALVVLVAKNLKKPQK